MVLMGKMNFQLVYVAKRWFLIKPKDNPLGLLDEN
jgi:hypothetical protein